MLLSGVVQFFLLVSKEGTNNFHSRILSFFFKQEQMEMCHSPKVEDGVENKLFTSWTHVVGNFLLKNFKLSYILNRESF